MSVFIIITIKRVLYGEIVVSVCRSAKTARPRVKNYPIGRLVDLYVSHAGPPVIW
jgi:hypothetical protein